MGGIWTLQVPRAVKPVPAMALASAKKTEPAEGQQCPALCWAGSDFPSDRSRSLSPRAQLCCCRNLLPLYWCQSKEKPHMLGGFQLTSSHALYTRGGMLGNGGQRRRDRVQG